MKVLNSLIIIFLFLVSICPVMAENRPLLAVMDFKPMADVSPDLSEELAGYFISEIKALTSFNLISRSRIDQKFTPRLDGYCDTLSSAVKRGEALRAELVIFAAVRKEGGEYIIESTLVRVPDAKVINSGSTTVSSMTRGLRAKGAELAAIDLVGNFAFIPAGAAPTPAQLPPARSSSQPVIDRSKRPEPVTPAAASFQPYLQFGLKGGLTIAGLYGGSSGDWDGRTGFGFGFILRWWISDSFVIQPELLYTMKGAEYSEDYLGSPLKITMEMDYLEVPILLKYYFPVDWAIKPHVFAGPSLGFKINDDLKATYEGESISIPDSVSDLKSYEAGLVFGVGLDYPLGPGSVNLDIRYSPSVTAVFNSGDEKNSVWAFTLGYVY
jgi:outer membrane protein with beta-barrel domain